MHYEKAYLNGELDPAFTNMTTWECRFITNSDAPDEQIAWGREMLRNYRPDLIFGPDYRWRYSRIVKTDVAYKRPAWTGSPLLVVWMASLTGSRGVVTVRRVETGCGRRAPSVRSQAQVWDRKWPGKGKVKWLAYGNTTVHPNCSGQNTGLEKHHE